ncbi:MAG: hypothetical protein MJZ60_06290 [Bacteroidaceae bacterium]|nr:hypothetical protein [Bacteroidaceae bacterium]
MTNEEYIDKHRTDNVRALALKKAPEGIDALWCLQQIEGWQQARRKLPRWAATEGVWFPPRISMEQCSSEATALYKQRVVERLLSEAERDLLADFTGGFGIDFSYMASSFRKAVYVEMQPHLCDIARHNFDLLGMHHAVVVNDRSPIDLALYAAEACSSHTLVYLDPARRDDVGRKVVALEDCTPNVVTLQDELRRCARFVVLKLSPMLDITQAVRQLRNVSQVHVVSVQGECKEVLLVIDNGERSEGVTYHCADLRLDAHDVSGENECFSVLGNDVSGGNECFSVLENDERVVPDIWTGQFEAHYLYEPNASVLKAGVQDYLCQHLGVAKLHAMSNLFVSEQYVEGFPGRAFRIEQIGDFSKAGLKQMLSGIIKANLTVRNFPATVAELRKRLKLKEGGDVYLFATTMHDGKHAIIRTRK